MAPFAQGHEKITLALITLLPIFVFYGLVYPFFLIIIPIILIGLGGHLFFFRDPRREINIDSRLILSPADGTIYDYDTSEGIIRIRLSLFNVHVTRCPVSGDITEIDYFEGKHWPFLSFVHRGTLENARQTIQIVNSLGKFLIVQIVGIIARRCTSYLSPGDQVQQGDRLGMIYYGSEVDIHFPANKFEILIKKRDKVVAGQTPIALLKERIIN